MPRRPITPNALRALFARSGNVCAFPDCRHELVDSKNRFVAQLCHIEAASPGGERYNEKGSDEGRRGYENLILLCYRHHVETDDVVEYPASRLREMKARHERECGGMAFEVDESVVQLIERSMREYWGRVQRVSMERQVAAEFAVPVDAHATAPDLFDALRVHSQDVQQIAVMLAHSDAALEGEARAFLTKLGYDLRVIDDLAYCDNPFINRNWELHSLAAPNTHTRLHSLLLQIEVRYWEEYLKTHFDDGVAQVRFARAQADLQEFAAGAALAD